MKNIFSQKIVLSPLFASLIWGCFEPISLNERREEELAGCQSCHISPPPTGEHDLHLFNQTHRTQITCDECHGSSIKKMIWDISVKKRVAIELKGWQAVSDGTDSLTLLTPKVDTTGYSFCIHEVRNRELYSGALDSFAVFESLVPSTDSVFVDQSLIYVFPLTGSVFQIDTTFDPVFGVIIDTTFINTYGDPTTYNPCSNQIRNDSLFQTAVQGKNTLVRQLNVTDTVVLRPEINRIFVLAPNLSLLDTINFQKIAAEASLLGKILPDDREEFTSDVSGTSTVLFGNDSMYYQLSGDTLFLLNKDSSISFGDNIFAELTNHHMNGSVDVLFKFMDTTLYREDTIQVFRDSITGEVTFANVKTSGSWIPKKLSCASDGLEAFKCHDRVNGITKWYRPQTMLMEDFP